MTDRDTRARRSAVIVDYDAGPFLADCVRSLDNQGLAELIVVENGDADAARATLAAHGLEGTPLLATGRNLGYGAGANRGLAAIERGEHVLICNPDLVVHEGGHNLFGWFGPTLGLWGGTLLQWLVPFLLAVYFFTQRQTTGFVFCLFFFFENWLYTATYMADARAQALPLVTTGDPDFVEHDFYAIFSSLGVLNHDTQIAALVRVLGRCGMLAVVVWLAMRTLRNQET